MPSTNKWYSVKYCVEMIKNIEFNVNYIDERFYGVEVSEYETLFF